MMTYLFIDECSNDVKFTTALSNPTVLALVIILAVIGVVVALILVLCKACNCHLNQGKQNTLEVTDEKCNTTANSSNESIAKEQINSAENVYQQFDTVVAFDRNRGAIALGGKCR